MTMISDLILGKLEAEEQVQSKRLLLTMSGAQGRGRKEPPSGGLRGKMGANRSWLSMINVNILH